MKNVLFVVIIIFSFQIGSNAQSDKIIFNIGTLEAFKIQENADGIIQFSTRNKNSSGNIFFGYESGDNAVYSSGSLGSSNTAFGYNTMVNSISGSSNSVFGYTALRENISGGSNTAIGRSALLENLTGSSNTAIGRIALRDNNGSFNVGVGSDVLVRNKTGERNVAIGHSAGAMDTLATNSVYVGFGAGRGGVFATDEHMKSDNVMIGNEAGYFCKSSGNVFLGNKAGTNETADNRLYITNDNTDQTSSLIYGEFDNQLLRVNGSTYIDGSSNPASALEVDGTATTESLIIDGVGLDALTWDSGAGVLQNSADAIKWDRPGFSILLDADNNNSTATQHSFKVFSDVASSGANTPFVQFDAFGADSYLNLDDDGDFGIGTTNPTDALHVVAEGLNDPFRVQVSSSTKFKIFNNGAVVIGNTGGVAANTFYVKEKTGLGVLSPTYKLELPNNATISAGRARAQAWITYSDKRVKKNVTSLENGLDQVMRLNPVTYNHYSSSFDSGNLELSSDFSKDIGFLAQEVYEVIEEVVMKPEDENKDLWSMNYEKLTPVLVKAIQEQQEMIKSQQKLINQLMDGHKKMMSELAELKEHSISNTRKGDL